MAADDDNVRSVGMRMAAFVQFGSKYANIAVQLFITAVLARILTPDDYGIVAITTVFTAFFAMLSDTGIGTAVVQYRDLSNEDHGALMTFTLVLGAVLTASFCLVAWPISWIYSEPRVLSQCWASSGAILLGTANMVPNGLLLRDKRFLAIGVRLLVSSVVSGVLAVVAALAGLGPYSIAIQSTASAAIVLAWNLAARPVRHLTMHFVGPLRRVFRYSAFQFGFNFINYFSRNLDNLLIGRFMGTIQLAYYDKAYKLTTYPLSSVTGVIGSVVQPFMSERQNEPSRIFDGWLRIEKLISLVAAPVTVAFACFSSEMVLLLYGDSWVASVPIFHTLAYSVYFQMMNNTSGAFFQSLGRTDLLFQTGAINTGITVVAIVVGVNLGNIESVSMAVLVAYFCHSATVFLQLVRRGFGSSLKCLGLFLPECLVAVAGLASCALICTVFPYGTMVCTAWKAITLVACFGIGYAATGQFVYLAEVIRRRR